MSQQWERSPAQDSSNLQPNKTPQQLEEALLDIIRNHLELAREEARAILDRHG